VNALAPLVVGHTDDGDLTDGRVLLDDLLNLGRVNVEAAGNDDIVRPVQQVDVAVLVELPDIARVDPTVLDSLGCLLGKLIVALHLVGRPGDDFAGLVRFGDLGAVLEVDDLHLGHQRLLAARREEFRLVLRVVVVLAQRGNEVRHLRLAVELDEHVAERVYALAKTLGRHRRGAVHERVERARVRLFDRGVVEGVVDDGRHHEGPRDFLSLDERQGLFGVEPVRYDAGAATDEAGPEERTCRMGERRHQEELFAGADVDLDEVCIEVLDEVVVGVFEPLRVAGRPGGVRLHHPVPRRRVAPVPVEVLAPRL